jgi:probable F420-dependent oxidoreductase
MSGAIDPKESGDAGMSTTRLGNTQPGRVGAYAGLLAVQPAAVQREVVREVERLGFGAMWFGEPVPGREAFVQASIFLNATERIVVGTGIASIYARDAYAAQAAGRALAEASNDRFILGLGVSHPAVVGRRGHVYARPVPAMTEYLDGVAAASAEWRGLAANAAPIILGALRPQMLRLSGERTAGAFLYFTTDEHAREARAIIGSDPFLVADLAVVVEPDPARARTIGNWHTSRYLKIDNYRTSMLRLGFSEADVEPPGSQRLFDAVVAWGSAERIAERVRSRLQAGADHVVLNFATDNPRRTWVTELAAVAPALHSELG